jgi:hypothetical protein
MVARMGGSDPETSTRTEARLETVKKMLVKMRSRLSMPDWRTTALEATAKEWLADWAGVVSDEEVLPLYSLLMSRKMDNFPLTAVDFRNEALSKQKAVDRRPTACPLCVASPQVGRPCPVHGTQSH